MLRLSREKSPECASPGGEHADDQGWEQQAPDLNGIGSDVGTRCQPGKEYQPGSRRRVSTGAGVISIGTRHMTECMVMLADDI